MPAFRQRPPAGSRLVPAGRYPPQEIDTLREQSAALCAAAGAMAELAEGLKAAPQAVASVAEGAAAVKRAGEAFAACLGAAQAA